MNSLPLHLLDQILFKMEPKSQAIMRCTNKFFKSYILDPKFEKYSIWSSLLHLSKYGTSYIFSQPLVSSSDSMSTGTVVPLSGNPCYYFGSCSGLLLLYIGGLFVVNPVTKRFRLLNHSGSKFFSMIDGGYPKALVREKANCVGFAVHRNGTTKRFKIVCIVEKETMYSFEISDGYSWKLSETTITTSSKSGLNLQMKPVYLDETLYWLRNDGSLIAFNPETESAGLIPSVFHQESDIKLLFAADDKINRLTLISGSKETISVYILLENTEWTPARQIKNVSMDENELLWWNIIVYDGKQLVTWEKKYSLNGVVHVFDMETNSWGVSGLISTWLCADRNFYKFKPSLLFVNEEELPKVVVASDDPRVSALYAVMGLIDSN